MATSATHSSSTPSLLCELTTSYGNKCSWRPIPLLPSFMPPWSLLPYQPTTNISIRPSYSMAASYLFCLSIDGCLLRISLSSSRAPKKTDFTNNTFRFSITVNTRDRSLRILSLNYQSFSTSNRLKYFFANHNSLSIRHPSFEPLREILEHV